MDSLDYVLQLKARRGDHLAYQAAVEFERAIESQRVEIEQLQTVMRNLRNEAAGVAGMEGLRELIGNTNYACLERRIAEAEELLQTKNTAGDLDMQGNCLHKPAQEFVDSPEGMRQLREFRKLTEKKTVNLEDYTPGQMRLELRALRDERDRLREENRILRRYLAPHAQALIEYRLSGAPGNRQTTKGESNEG